MTVKYVLNEDTGEITERWDYAYNLFNQLESVRKDGETVASYRYDHNGLLVQRIGASGETTRYLHSLNGKLLEQHGDKRSRRFIYVFNRNFAEKRVDRTLDGATVIGEEERTLFYITDHLGSTVAMADEDGNIVWGDNFTPFGSSTGEWGYELEESGLFTGKFMDEATGLYYYNARWYDPELGRFVTEDPVRDGLNWFVYASNNPLKYVDPSGLSKWAAEVNMPDISANSRAGHPDQYNEQYQEIIHPLNDRTVVEGDPTQRDIQKEFDHDVDDYCAVTSLVQPVSEKAESVGADVDMDTIVEGIIDASETNDPWNTDEKTVEKLFNQDTGDTHPLAVNNIYDAISSNNPDVPSIPKPEFIKGMSYEHFWQSYGSIDWDSASLFYGSWGDPHVQTLVKDGNNVIESNTFPGWTQLNNSSDTPKEPFHVWLFKFEE